MADSDVKVDFANFLIDEHTFEVGGKEYSVKKGGTKVPPSVADKIVELSGDPNLPTVVKVGNSENG